MAAAAVLSGAAERDEDIRVDLPGGCLTIRWNSSDNHISMTGPAVEVFSGEIRLPWER